MFIDVIKSYTFLCYERPMTTMIKSFATKEGLEF